MDNKTEKPTPKRLKKSREEGQFPVSRQFVGALQFLVFVAFLGWMGGSWFGEVIALSRSVLKRAFGPDLSVAECTHIIWRVAWVAGVPLLTAGGALMVTLLGGQFAVTNLGFSLKKLMPSAKRISPLGKLKELPHQNLSGLAQALVLLPVFIWIVYAVATERLGEYMLLPLQNVYTATAQVAGSIQSVLWRAAGVFLVFGGVEFLRERRRHSKQLMMSKQEIREEMKEAEGNPQIKMRIRRLQREIARRRMLSAVKTATAVVVNPTHYAVALKYDFVNMPAPIVVAKGADQLAFRIRSEAAKYDVPIVENPPLARGLYAAAEVGREIPAEFFRAVAEVLAYIYRVLNMRPPA